MKSTFGGWGLVFAIGTQHMELNDLLVLSLVFSSCYIMVYVIHNALRIVSLFIVDKLTMPLFVVFLCMWCY